MTVPAIIPARGGSKGIPRKNVREVGGKPLLAHTIEAANGADTVDRTIITTDDDEIATVAAEYGAEVPFDRPDELAADDVPVIAAFEHAAEYLSEHGTDIEYLVGLQPTCPFTAPSDINEGVRKARASGCDSVVSVSKVTDTHPYRAYRLDGDRVEPLNGVTVTEPDQRQDRPDVYGLTGAVLVRTPSLLFEWDGSDFALGSDVRAVVQPKERALDIDTPFELRVARALCEYETNRGDTDG